MPYILNKTNGDVLTTLTDASVDVSTNLTFVGRNYSGYGEVVNENFLKLLENFANRTEPTKPITGQMWFDTVTKRLAVYNGTAFKRLSLIESATSGPAAPNEGDIWWNSSAKQLYVWNGTSWTLIGPTEASDAKTSWTSVVEYDANDTDVSVPILEALIGETPMVVVANQSFTPTSASILKTAGSDFEFVQKGITLPGADSATGSSKDLGYYFWGTAAESLVATTATNITVAKDETTNANMYLTFVSTTTGNRPVFASGNLSYNPFTNVLNMIASAAKYADIAERYAADAEYDAGTVLVIGGTHEVTQSTVRGDIRVAGIVSSSPAYMMNSYAGTDSTHPFVALKGRVPCKVVGPVAKGDLLVTSSISGYAERATETDNPRAIIGIALEALPIGRGFIEVKV